MITSESISTCLWFNSEAEEAANFYTSIFPGSEIGIITRYPAAGQEIHRQKPGSVMTVTFKLQGREFMGLNAGPQFSFTEAVSFIITCADQQEVDYYWSKLTAGGEEGPCGWLKDKFGLSWQVVPKVLQEMMSSPDTEKTGRVMTAFMKMKKFNISELKQAFDEN
jgi:predicted 3-demethylubiquinone-9 3-methyltransferase (glyoxalase superfamily)